VLYRSIGNYGFNPSVNAWRKRSSLFNDHNLKKCETPEINRRIRDVQAEGLKCLMNEKSKELHSIKSDSFQDRVTGISRNALQDKL